MKAPLFLLIFLSFLFSSDLLQAQGKLDASFGINGVKTISTIFPGTNPYSSIKEHFNATLIQPDGKILLAGSVDTATNTYCYMTRLNNDGSYDPSFNGGIPKIFVSTMVSTHQVNEIKAIALQDDGKILLTGNTAGIYGYPTTIFLLRLNADGSMDTGFANQYNLGATATGNSIAFDKNTRKILVAGTASNKLVVYRFNSDGSTDNTFATAGIYTSALTNTTGVSIAVSSDGSILVGGSYLITNQFFYIVKLSADGITTTFSNSSIQFISGANCNSTSIINLPDGRILLGGWTNTTSSPTSPRDFAFGMLLPNGNFDTNFGAAATPGKITYDNAGNDDYMNTMVLQPDGKIIASGSSLGTAPISYFTSIRIDNTGKLDNSYGTNGIFIITTPQGKCNSSDIDLTDGTGILAGATSASDNDMMVARINAYSPQKINILGKQIVSIETENTYHINPVISGYQYTWTYSNSNIYVLGANTNDSVTLYFRNTTPSGTLTCNIFNSSGKQVYTSTISIQVNPEPTLAQQLANPACTPAQSSCDLTYISSVQITKTHADGTGCSPSGYSDLTAISNYDTLYKGDNYGALVIHGGLIGNNTYCGIWVDLDNNGVINPTKEFVGSGLSTNSEIKVNNIFIPSDVELGPKRLRVRIRNGSPFTADDFCIANNDLGETQDYLIVMQAYQDFQAPNFITPNNDGKNDYFIIHGVKSEQTNELKVYSKAGDLVYETDHYDNQWGGRNKSNELLVKGTYYYVFIKDPSSNDSKNVERGFFEIRY